MKRIGARHTHAPSAKRPQKRLSRIESKNNNIQKTANNETKNEEKNCKSKTHKNNILNLITFKSGFIKGKIRSKKYLFCITCAVYTPRSIGLNTKPDGNSPSTRRIIAIISIFTYSHCFFERFRYNLIPRQHIGSIFILSRT